MQASDAHSRVEYEPTAHASKEAPKEVMAAFVSSFFWRRIHGWYQVWPTAGVRGRQTGEFQFQRENRVTEGVSDGD